MEQWPEQSRDGGRNPARNRTHDTPHDSAGETTHNPARSPARRPTRNTARDVSGTAVMAGSVGDIHLAAPGDAARLLRSLADLPLTGEFAPFAAGVHRARHSGGSGALPPYVARDRDDELRGRVAAAAADGGLVLVVGPSTAGKTRAALEAVRGALPRHRVLSPDPGSDLHRLPELVDTDTTRWMLWLDNMEGHLRPGGLGPELVSWLVRARVPIVATMRTKVYRRLRSELRGSDGPDGQGAGRRDERMIGMRVLNAADPVHLERTWSAAELRRLRSVAAAEADGRLAEAYAHHGDFGPTEYLAAGPELLDEWRGARRPTADDGNPRGHALVAAATDLARTGLSSPVPRTLLDEVHAGYLADAVLLRPEGLAEAWAWATGQRLGVTSLLVPCDLEQSTWRAFDYLVDADHTTEVPEHVWRRALDHATGEERWLIGRTARDAGLPEIAEAAWLPLAEQGESRAMNSLGVLLEERGDYEGAAEWFGRTDVAESGDALYRIARSFRGRAAAPRTVPANAVMDRVSTEYWMRRAAEAGHVQAMFELAALVGRASMLTIFDGPERQAEAWAAAEAAAEHWYRAAASAGHTGAMVALAGLLMRRDPGGGLDGAAEWFRAAADGGDAQGMYGLARVCRERGETADAEQWLRDAARSGHVHAGYDLVRMYERRGDRAESARWLGRAVRSERRGVADTLAAYLHRGGS
ncbi:hypothetical protein CLV63_1392 [Murinocardiopsis flavida]|uniref:TPR repeat protein n=1 Tax=Murinocardiopsis flavida TaxID=645275 RepID=A0A2P8CGS9_9ACTN|nr:sel1 repeat family protein [Murinocardiopsis flavida]PSK84183.1 hypothetical protein CLV63_1392 [Murinocardiopsis flavida]